MSLGALPALAFAVARTPQSALVAHEEDGARCWSVCTLGPALYTAEGCDTALAGFAAALDARFTAHRGPVDPLWALGWVSYDAAREAADPRERRDPRPPRDSLAAACIVPVVARATTQTWPPVWRVSGPGSAALDAMLKAREAPESDFDAAFALPPEAEHRARVEAIKALIRDGEVYLVNLAERLFAPHGPTDRDTAAFLARCFAKARPARGMLLNLGAHRVAAMTMERALTWDRQARRAVSEPIKGTRPRALDDPEADRRAAQALAESPKERAENAMAVDVHRNDLGRVATVGGVSVPSLFRTEAHAFVHHLVSTVEAEVPQNLSAFEMLQSVLPVGSVTGAPKLAAFDVISALEAHRRGLYTGALATLGSDGSLDASVVIRTLVDDEAGLHYGVGGGIVYDSVAAEEYAELGWKVRALRRG
ncbi:MAG: anthranilate synthase component I family protein [Myxococcales bacterium]|nr:anthranilate synthase component I family protein [Myxococcales bacterium]